MVLIQALSVNLSKKPNPATSPASRNARPSSARADPAGPRVKWGWPSRKRGSTLCLRLIRAHSSFEAKTSDQMVFGKPVERRALAQRRLPARLGRRDFGLARLGLPLQVFQPGLERVELFPLCAGRCLDHRGRVAELDRPPVLGDVVEEGEELVEILLCDRVELVAVAAGAGERQAQPDRCRCIDAIDDVLDGVLLGDDAPLAVATMVAIEPGRDPLVEGWRRQQIAGELLDREPVERQIAVVGIDHPVAPPPHDARAVGLIAAGVGVPGRVQPSAGQSLTDGG